MADIKPFKGMRYSGAHVRDLTQVLAPPYDVITPDLQESLYESHHYNCVRLTFGKIYGSDTPEDNRYSRAAQSLQAWLEKGVLVREAEPSIYVTSTEYQPPLWPSGPPGGEVRRQLGFVALFKLKPLTSGDIFPHEHTHGPPKEDRYKLLEATRANFCQVYGMYADPGNRVEAFLKKTVRGQTPKSQFTMADGSNHRLWIVSNPAVHTHLGKMMQKIPLVIADGHHRYEAAHRYYKDHPGKDVPWAYVLMYFTRIEGTGLTIYPTHRLISGIEKQEVESFVKFVTKSCTVRRIPMEKETPQKMARRLLAEMSKRTKTPFFALYPSGSSDILLVDAKSVKGKNAALASIPKPLRNLSVPVLHAAFIDPLLAQGKGRDDRKLSFGVDPVDVMRAVDEGRADMAFFLNGISPQQVHDAARKGFVLPAKTTYFYPKRLSGLVSYKWE